MKLRKAFFFIILAAIFGCAGERSTQTQETSLDKIPADQANKLNSASEDVLGEFYILAQTELNPALIEGSINEIMTARAAYLNIFEKGDDSDSDEIYEKPFRDTEDGITSEFYFSDLFSQYISEDDLNNLKKAEKSIRVGQKILHKYSSAIVSLARNLSKCWQEGNIYLLGCRSLKISPFDISCNVEFVRCEIDSGYSVSGTSYIVLKGNVPSNFSYSLTFNNLKFEKSKDKYINFVSGTLSGSVTSALYSVIWDQTVNGVRLEDTEDKISLEGSISHNASYQEGETESKLKVVFRDFSLTRRDDNTSYTVDGVVDIEDREKGNSLVSYDLNIVSDNGTIALKGLNKREKSRDPKFIAREDSVDVGYSSSGTSFSLSGYRYKSVKHEKTQDGKTFSLSITSYLKVNGDVIRSYNHTLTAVKGEGSVKLSGIIEIIIDQGEKIIAELKDVVFQRGCNRPVGGIIYGYVVRNGESIDLEIVFNEGCVCDVGVKSKVDNKTVVFIADICSAGENMKDKIKDHVKRKGYGMMSGGESSHHHGMH
ncbi:MAG: hypothetical protein NZ927_06435 [Candidatus Calescibacterium sp.]|nr:hypothetical protein [Candidatus Calescibacterium sp.]